MHVSLQADNLAAVTLKVPAAHGEHIAAPARLKVPAGQVDAVALVDPAGHVYPAEHAPLHNADTCPAHPNLPASHCPLHELFESPTVAPNKPGAQVVQLAAPAVLYRPAGHKRAVALVEPTGQEYPAAQGPLHAGDGSPATSPKLPAGQAVQFAAPARLYRPGGQMDAVALEDPAGQLYPAEQGPLHADEFRPTVDASDQKPAGHGEQLAAPAKLN